jgi:hypothetical protein
MGDVKINLTAENHWLLGEIHSAYANGADFLEVKYLIDDVECKFVVDFDVWKHKTTEKNLNTIKEILNTQGFSGFVKDESKIKLIYKDSEKNTCCKECEPHPTNGYTLILMPKNDGILVKKRCYPDESMSPVIIVNGNPRFAVTSHVRRFDGISGMTDDKLADLKEYVRLLISSMDTGYVDWWYDSTESFQKKYIDNIRGILEMIDEDMSKRGILVNRSMNINKLLEKAS